VDHHQVEVSYATVRAAGWWQRGERDACGGTGDDHGPTLGAEPRPHAPAQMR